MSQAYLIFCTRMHLTCKGKEPVRASARQPQVARQAQRAAKVQLSPPNCRGVAEAWKPCVALEGKGLSPCLALGLRSHREAAWQERQVQDSVGASPA